jgi:hypothetical protein
MEWNKKEERRRVEYEDQRRKYHGRKKSFY